MNSASIDQQADREILCFRTYDEWRSYLQCFEIETGNHFIISAETKGFSKEVTLQDILQLNPTPKLRWEFKASNCSWPIPYTGSPYLHLGMQEYHCHKGRDLNYKKKEQRKLCEDHVTTKRRKVIQPTKKQDCPIKFVVKKIYRFINYKLEKDSKRSRKKMLDDIRLNEFSSGNGRTVSMDPMNSANIVQYLVVMPTDCHHHISGKPGGTTHPLDNRVKEFIISQIQQGCTRPKDIEIKVEDFVKENIFNGGRIPEEYRDIFFPSRKKISNIKVAVNKCSQILQENLENLVEDWTRLASGELLTGNALTEPVEPLEEPVDHVHPAGITVDDCCYFTVDKLNVSNDANAEQKSIDEKRMNIRSTLQQFIDVTDDIKDFKLLDDIENALTACLDKLRKSMES